jgi:hypothetical protein
MDWAVLEQFIDGTNAAPLDLTGWDGIHIGTPGGTPTWLFISTLF